MGSTKKGLWKDVLESKYGLWSMTNSFTPNQNRYKSRWWNDLSKVSLSDQGDNWVNSNMVWQHGSEDKIKFWEDEWLANGQLKGRYERIYNNYDLKDKTIGNFGSWSTQGWEWKFSWRREWFEWERTMIEEFMENLSQVSLYPNKEDLRLWNDPPLYTISGGKAG